MDINQLSSAILHCAFKVHSALGPGLLESAYNACLVQELRLYGLRVDAGVPLPITYKGVILDVGYRMDIVVENKIIIELKAVAKFHPVHSAQLLSYLRLANLPLGLLLNFHEHHLRDGIKRIVNGSCS